MCLIKYNKIFSHIWIAKKGEKRGQIEYDNFLEKYWDYTNGTFFKQEIDWEKILNNAGKIHLFYSAYDNLIPLMHVYEIRKRIGGEMHWIKDGRHLDVDLERIPDLTETILKTHQELASSSPERQLRKVEY